MSQMSSKLEQVLEFLVNGEQDKAQELLHDTIVEKAREIHEEIVNSQENDTVTEEESSDSEEEAVEETVGGTGDEEEDLKAELKHKAEDHAEEIDYEQTNEDDDEDEDDAKDEEEHEEEVEDMKKDVSDIEQALEELKAKFQDIIGNDEEPADEESEEDNGDMEMEMPAEESAEPLEEAELKAVKVDHADGSDATKSPVAGAPKENANGAKPGMSTGGEEKGSAPAKATDMGATTEPNMSAVKADSKDGSDSSAKSPVASK